MDVGLELVIQRVEVGIGGAGIGDLASGLELGDVGEMVVGQRDQRWVVELTAQTLGLAWAEAEEADGA